METLIVQNYWGELKAAPDDKIFALADRYIKDTDPSKISLAIGAYRDEEGKPYIFNIVRKVEEEILKEKANKEYLPIDGNPTFTAAAKKLIFGEDCKILDQIVTIQSLSGTGALKVACELLFKALPKGTKVYLSDPTWPNHTDILKASGFADQINYPYYDLATNSLKLKEMMDCLSKAPAGSIVLLHGCAHNPTGMDPTKEEWKEIIEICKSCKLIPFIDLAYQGFASGDLDNDGYVPRAFAAAGLEFLVAQSFSKNVGLYGERIGALHVVCAKKESVPKVLSNLKASVRAMYSNPPCHGALIMAKILSDPKNTNEWKEELKKVAGRIKEMRKLLFDELVALKTPGNWEHITKQIGMFSYTGLTKEQCKAMVEKHHVYLLESGRASMPGINHKNYKYLAKAMHDVVTTIPKQ